VTAYDALRSNGLLESRQGSGTRVCTIGQRPRAHPDGDIAGITMNPVYRSLMRESDHIISLATAVLPADPCLAEAFADFAANDAAKLWEHIGYSPAGLPELRTAIAEHLSDSGTPTTPDQVVVTTGAQQAVNLAAMTFVQSGDEVTVESPTFAGTIDAFRSRGARLVTVPTDDDGVDAQAIKQQAESRRPSAVYVMPSFHNPTGAQLSEARRRTLAELATTHDVPIIEDNTLEYFPVEAKYLRPIAAFAGDDAPVLSAGSLNKAAWGGLRIGWIRSPRRLSNRLAELKALTDLGSPLIDQAIATRILPQLDEVRERHRVTLRRHLQIVTELLVHQLPEWEWNTPQGGASLWVRLPSGDSSAYAQVALRHGVEVIPGQMMSPASAHHAYFRLPFTAEPTVLEETVRRLADAWHAYSPRETSTVSGSIIV
jgi:DNA-binding transcriptional MocR family regulator